MKPLILILLYLAVVLAPLIGSASLGGPPRPLLQELATGLGILAFSMILVEFILSGRFKQVSNGIGMDVTMRFHQVMARAALVLALLHPLLYRGTPSGGPRPWDTTRQLTLTTDVPDLISGIAAYVLLPAFVLLAVGRKKLSYKYETWRLMHGLGALIIALLVLHHAISAGRYAGLPALTWLWIAMTGAAVGTLLYVYLVVPLLHKAQPWRVAAVTQLTPQQWEVTITPEGHEGLGYHAGQFVWLNLGHSPFSLHEHPFSIASAPAAAPNLSFMIKELGDFTRSIGQIPPGTPAHLAGPFGNLSVAGRREPGIALLAGGVGLAPLIGIYRQLRLTDDPRAVRLVYGNRTREQIAYREELTGDDVVLVLSEPPDDWQGETGVIDTTLIDRLFTQAEIDSWLFVICGPAVMMNGVENHLLARGTPSHRILTERFDYD